MAAAKKSAKKSPVKKSPVRTVAVAVKRVVKSALVKTDEAKKATAKKGVARANAPSKKASVAKITPPKPGGGTEAKSLVGKNAPPFELQDQSGSVISSLSLKGKPYVLYFYPRDNTPGCTQESCQFRDEERNFRKNGVTILGVSPDSVKSHSGFASKFSLPFSLLSDPEKKLAEAYGVWALKKNYGREYWGIVRSTFLIDKSGKVAAEWRPVKVSGHAVAVLAEVKK